MATGLGHGRFEEVFGIESALLSDDRLARALDAVAPHLEKVASTVGARAIAEFGIEVSGLHWDMTTMSVHGAYPTEEQDEQYPVIGYGHPKDRRVELKQVQAGLAVSADGASPCTPACSAAGRSRSARSSERCGTCPRWRASRNS